MKNGFLLESSMVVLGGMVAPLMGATQADATTIFDATPGQTSVVSTTLSSHVSGVLVSGGGTVLFTTSNSYSGGTVVDGGSTLGINQDTGLGNTTGTLTLGDATTSGVLTFNGESTVTSSTISSSLEDERGILINGGGGTIITNSGTIVTSVYSSGSTSTTTSITSSYVADLAGTISGTGKLTVTGGGTLELSGDNVWTGGTLVEDGSTLEISKQYNLGADTNTLTLDSGTLAFALGRPIVDPISLGSGGGTIDVQTHNDTISGIITGAGQLTVADSLGSSTSAVGSGMLTLTGAETYTGGTVVEGGTLRLDSASLLGDVLLTSHTYSYEVFSGSGTSAVTSTTVGGISGVGSIGGTLSVASGGVVTPGLDGVGALTVGNYVQSSGGTLNIEVGSGGASELIVTSNATLAGNLDLQYGGYAQPGTYSYLDVGGTTTGAFTSTTDHLLGAGMESNVEGNSFTLTQNKALPTGDLPTLVIASNDAAEDEAQFSNRLILDRLQSVRTTALAQRDEVALSDHHEVRNLSPYGLWVAPLGGFGSASGENGAPGYSTRKYGLALGIDRENGPGWVEGLAFEYTHQSVSQSGGGTASMGTPRIQAYTGFWRGPYAVDFVVGDGSASITTKRSLNATLSNIFNGTTLSQSFAETANGTHSDNELTTALQASGNYLLDYRWAVSPAVGVKVAHLSELGFTESGTDYFNYRVLGQDVTSVRPYADVSATRRYYFNNGGALVPTVGVGVEGEVANHNASLQAQTFGDAYVWTVHGVAPAKIDLDVNLGLAYETSKTQSFGVKLMGTEGSTSDQTIVAQYGLRF